ncbi:MAG: twin-arginine translocation signal domain-containing protein [Gammaproteobacteria bacterium]|nr:twin-arginine translocation signal domain-containing protein [Gammaproteobacteria bacterium]
MRHLAIPERRRFLQGLAALGAAGALPRLRAQPLVTAQTFTLGVASGYPSPSGVVLWTRLAPLPYAPGGGMPPVVVPVRWEVAEDAGFKKMAASGVAYAEPAWGHSVHVEVRTLAPAREYWYRFHAGAASSPVGRTRTAPRLGAKVDQLRFAFASCQQFEQGYYGAYRHLAAETLDLVIHLGDYIYESSWGERPVRPHEGPTPVTLEDYRARYACYKQDESLQAAHAACPWLMVWDDHEVENDYADDRSQNADAPRWFLARRAAAYQAWYEHMPVPRSMVPFGPDLRLYTSVNFGRLVDFKLLDDRQYRSPQPCPKPGRGGGNVIKNCAARLDPAATLLGARQEAWLGAGLAASKTHWNILAQQTLMAQSDSLAGPGQRFYADGWDGYPAARERLFQQLAAGQVANPVVIGGNVHSFWVADLKRDFNRPESATISTEFVGGSITSHPPSAAVLAAAQAEGPHIHLATGAYHGYVRLTLTPQRLTADLRGVADIRDPHTGITTFSSWVVAAGRPGALPA